MKLFEKIQLTSRNKKQLMINKPMKNLPTKF